MIKKLDIYYDKDGIKYQRPERSCARCKDKPCFDGFDSLNLDFAKYGCIKFKEA